MLEVLTCWRDNIIDRIIKTERIPDQMRIRWELGDLYRTIDWVALSNMGHASEKLYFLLNLLFHSCVPCLSVGIQRNKDILEEYVNYLVWLIDTYLQLETVDYSKVLHQLYDAADDDMKPLAKRFFTGRMYEYAYRFRYDLYRLMFKAECACQGFPYGFNLLYLNSKTVFYTDGWQLQSSAGYILSEKRNYEPNFITLDAVINGGECCG